MTCPPSASILRSLGRSLVALTLALGSAACSTTPLPGLADGAAEVSPDLAASATGASVLLTGSEFTEARDNLALVHVTIEDPSGQRVFADHDARTWVSSGHFSLTRRAALTAGVRYSVYLYLDTDSSGGCDVSALGDPAWQFAILATVGDQSIDLQPGTGVAGNWCGHFPFGL